MDETVPAASSASRSKESPSLPVSKSFLFNSSAFEEGDRTLFVGGFQTVMGMIANGYSTALSEGPFSFTADPGRGCELKTLRTSAKGDSACSGFRTWVDGEEEDAPNFGTLTKAGRSFSTDSGFSVSRSGAFETVSPTEPEAPP